MFDFTQIPLWTLALFPLVVLALWGWYRSKQQRRQQQSSLSSDYFKGLNYLLNDEQGKALDVFVKLVEANWDTIDTHFALGKIYRKNGEMDKAIKIHQGLIGRPSLPEKYRGKILLELGFDYLGAGWFDRAEGLFKEVLIEDPHSVPARQNLIMIYQQEKDWYKAIDIATELYHDNPAETGPMIAQYYCELAVQAQNKGDIRQLRLNAEKALDYDPACVRASILLAEQARREGDDDAAIAHYLKIERQDIESITLVLDALFDCYARKGQLAAYLDYLRRLEAANEKLFLQLTIARVLEQVEGREAARAYLSGRMKEQPSLEGMQKLLASQRQEDDWHALCEDIRIAAGIMQRERMAYRCRVCGFSSNTHYWLCPGCNHWGQIKPALGEICKIRTANELANELANEQAGERGVGHTA